ncbi:hypothetical protein [Alphabaculovirus altersperidaniae]|uniref:F-box domain-containing protein n=1 Tax=Spodoptera eridania nucleopolyhedrovirus TaxID=2315721 RepID=A0ABX6TQ48_9ABAC|nr:hypothetical protein QKS47_gp064 [Spodoptera eridania nucleopolyhedrovirus]QNV47874.1 hypothetical protein [Spodoptera eridania nucleopolyhedrovirus]
MNCLLNAIPQEMYDKICQYLDHADYMCLFEAVHRKSYKANIMQMLVSERNLCAEYPNFMDNYNYAKNSKRISVKFDMALMETSPYSKACSCHDDWFSTINNFEDEPCSCYKNLSEHVQRIKEVYNDGVIKYGSYVIFYNIVEESFNSIECSVLQNYFSNVKFDDDNDNSTSCLDKMIRRAIYNALLGYTRWSKNTVDDLASFYYTDNRTKLHIDLNVYTLTPLNHEDARDMICNLAKPINFSVWDYLVLPSVYRYKPLC